MEVAYHIEEVDPSFQAVVASSQVIDTVVERTLVAVVVHNLAAEALVLGGYR